MRRLRGNSESVDATKKRILWAEFAKDQLLANVELFKMLAGIYILALMLSQRSSAQIIKQAGAIDFVDNKYGSLNHQVEAGESDVQPL
ncbi:hypothetical protein K4G60_g4156 [Candida parapsilosis]|nr:hypothetical protein K4G60_g4156 [Candida parapsilosis]KAI5909623.1 hypothetical protein K4G61_g3311 [Candida parapsilosis]